MNVIGSIINSTVATSKCDPNTKQPMHRVDMHASIPFPLIFFSHPSGMVKSRKGDPTDPTCSDPTFSDPIFHAPICDTSY